MKCEGEKVETFSTDNRIEREYKKFCISNGEYTSLDKIKNGEFVLIPRSEMKESEAILREKEKDKKEKKVLE